MKSTSVEELLQNVEGALGVEGDTVQVTDEGRLRSEVIDHLVQTAVFGEGLVRETARWLIWQTGQALGTFPASIHDLYMARGSGDLQPTFTVPAINVRGMAYNTARAVFRAAKAHNVGALILEIARSEIGYTDQRPAEYVAVMLAAALKEGFRGPVFIQGDHFQISAKTFAADRNKELTAVRDLIKEAIDAGFYNIDIDTSTLVDLSKESLDEQQRLNYDLCAELTAAVREFEPEGVTVSLGGEIGEVGGQNSTVEELHAFMQGYTRALHDIYPGLPGISKISVQTGTSHGGVVLADGTLAEVKVDFDTLQELSRIARETYHIGGAVQHGASTLPETAFGKFPEVGTLEIHLATGFQNMIFEHAPAGMLESTREYCNANLGGERKSSHTDEQFFYNTRKKTFGPMKAQWWGMADEDQTRIGAALEKQFAFLFEQLQVTNTRDMVARVIRQYPMPRKRPQQAAIETELELASDLHD